MNFASQLRRRMIDNREAAKVGARWHLARQGQTAFLAGLTPVECPHVLDTPEQRCWVSGWMMAFDKRFQ
jgi:hypothetical protein